MSQTFTCVWHEEARVLESVLTGMWSGEDVTGYYANMRGLVLQHGSRGAIRLLTDLRQYPVQHQGTADVHAAMLPRIKANPTIEKAAWVTGKIVATMQAKRSLGDNAADIAVFRDREAAWAFLTN